MEATSSKTRTTRRRVRRGVIGIMENGRGYLLIRRAPTVAKAGYWCFPGGHVEQGETPRQAIQREMVEELGVEVLPTERLGAVRVPDGNYILVVWRVRHLAGRIKLATHEIAEIRWLTPAQIRAIHPSLPSNERVLQMLNV